MSPLFRFVLVLGVLFYLGLPLGAQTYGEINGTVTDASGAVVAAAAVTITNTATNNAARTVAANDAGRYDAPFLVPGAYNIRAERQGFKTEVWTGVDAQVSAVVQIDFTLQVGGVSETVELSGSAAQLETEGTAVGKVIDNRRIEDLPLNGRTFVQMVALSPNVTAETVSSGTASLRQGGERSTKTVVVAGERIAFMHYTLDGVENTDPNFNTFPMRPSLDATNPLLSYQFGNAARDTLFAPGTQDVDLSLIKTTHVTERQSFQLRFESFNFLNHPNWNAPSATVTSATFGVITTAKAMREVQVALNSILI